MIWIVVSALSCLMATVAIGIWRHARPPVHIIDGVLLPTPDDARWTYDKRGTYTLGAVRVSHWTETRSIFGLYNTAQFDESYWRVTIDGWTLADNRRARRYFERIRHEYMQRQALKAIEEAP